MMDCERVEQLLSEQLEGAVSERETRAMEMHLVQCPGCRRRQEEFRAVRSRLRALAEHLPIPASNVERGAIDRWLAERGTSPGRGRRWFWPASSTGIQAQDAPGLKPRSVPNESRRRGLGRETHAGGFRSGTDRGFNPGLSLAGAAATLLLAVLAFHWRGHAPAAQPPGVGVAHHAAPDAIRSAPEPSPYVAPQGAGREMANRPSIPSGQRNAPGSDAAGTAGPARGVHGSHSATTRSLTPRRFGQAHAEDDLDYLNSDSVHESRRWVSLRPDEQARIEARVRHGVRVRDDFVTLPFPRLASTSPRQIAAAVESYKREAAIVDPRLAREVDCAFKGTALSDVCHQLSTDTGIELTAGPSVADEKMTLFCEKMPLRDVMRQLSRPFGYTWLRSGTPGQYHYELEQDLRSQLLEEELRNRDRDEALIALDREMNRYRKYLDLSPDEALSRARTAPPEEKILLEHLATDGWGLVQIYFRLSPSEMAALRAGQTLIFSQEPKAGEQPLPADLARGILQSERDNRIFERDGAFRLGDAKNNPDGLLPAAVPEARAKLMLRMPQSELGQYTLTGGPGVFISASSQTPGGFSIIGSAGSLASGMSPAVLDPNNGAANANLARDPALQRRVTVSPDVRRPPGSPWYLPTSLVPANASLAGSAQSKIQNPKSKITTADVLEALHRATGRPIVSDFYTRLYPLQAVSPRNLPLFEALNQLSDAMRLHWGKDGAWLQFRSTSFFNDRLKEVPNGLLARWSASRHQHGAATLDDLIEMAQLSDAQLDAVDMAEGAKACWGLAEWDLVHRSTLRPQLRYMAGFTPEQRRMATSSNGLPFTRLSLAQQQQFLSFLLKPGAGQLPSGEELTGATLRVDYSLPGAFQWARPETGWRQFLPPPVCEPTREAALRAALRIDPQATDTQIAPTVLALSFLYTPGGPNVDAVRIVRNNRDGWWQP